MHPLAPPPCLRAWKVGQIKYTSVASTSNCIVLLGYYVMHNYMHYNIVHVIVHYNWFGTYKLGYIIPNWL